MGFSVSASAAVGFVGFVVAFTTLYPAVANGFERVFEAGADEELTRQNTAIELSTVGYDGANETLTVAITNTGAAELSVAETDLLVDDTYWDGSRSVEGDSATDVWHPDETLTITASNVTIRPDRVTVVTEHGVATEGSP